MRKAITFEEFLTEYFKLLLGPYEDITGNNFIISKEEEEKTSMTIVKIKDSKSNAVLVEGIDKDAYKAKDLAYQNLQGYLRNLGSSKIFIAA